jgi:uncharacterized protein (DUF1810 family)
LTGSHDLQRFVDAQERVYDRVTEELASGCKRSHWMWFVFPQLRGLGFSLTSRKYGISGLDEARAYLAHPVLGPRLRECTELMLGIEGRSVDDVLGYPDNLKFRSSMTLFAKAADDATLFDGALAKYFAGEPDDKTLGLLQ